MAELNETERALAVQMLRLAADTYSNHGCNDLKLPNTPENRALERAMWAWDEDPGRDENQYSAEDESHIWLMDWAVMRYLADRIEEGDGDVLARELLKTSIAVDPSGTVIKPAATNEADMRALLGTISDCLEGGRIEEAKGHVWMFHNMDKGGDGTWLANPNPPTPRHIETIAGVDYHPGPVISTAWQMFERVSDGRYRVVHFPFCHPAARTISREKIIAQAFRKSRNMEHEAAYAKLGDGPSEPEARRVIDEIDVTHLSLNSDGSVGFGGRVPARLRGLTPKKIDLMFIWTDDHDHYVARDLLHLEEVMRANGVGGRVTPKDWTILSNDYTMHYDCEEDAQKAAKALRVNLDEDSGPNVYRVTAPAAVWAAHKGPGFLGTTDW